MNKDTDEQTKQDVYFSKIHFIKKESMTTKLVEGGHGSYRDHAQEDGIKIGK